MPSSHFSVLDKTQWRPTAKSTLVGFRLDLLGEIFGLNFSFHAFSIRNGRSHLDGPAGFSEAFCPGFLQRGLFCLLERVFSCSFLNVPFCSDGSQGI